jgi:integrase/recombinase XerD
MLARCVQSYLSVRQSAGFELRCVGVNLRSFAAYSDAKGRRYVSSKTAIEWARQVPSVHQRARRLADVARFARYMRAEDARHEVPPAVFGSEKGPRPPPYILSDEQVRQLIDLAARPNYRKIHGPTYSTLFALLSCTGLRVSEALKLRYDDITPDGLVIRCSKYRKSRLVALHKSARDGLERYLRLRRPYAPQDDHLFISWMRKPLGNTVSIAHSRMRPKRWGCRRGGVNAALHLTASDTASPYGLCRHVRTDETRSHSTC